MMLTELLAKTSDFAKVRNAALDAARALEQELDAVKQRHAVTLKRTVKAMVVSHEELCAAIENNPSLFDTKKSYVTDGIKVGFQKGKDKVVVLSEQQFIETLQKHIENLPKNARADFETILKTETKIVVANLKPRIADNELLFYAMGASLAPGKDEVLVKPQDADSSKVLDTIIAAQMEELD